MNIKIDGHLEVVILAAGKGTRMHSKLPKVLHELAGEPLLAHVIRTVQQINPKAMHIVFGHGSDTVLARFEGAGANWVMQSEQMGTAHAVKTAMPDIESNSVVLVVYGDIPLVDAKELSGLVNKVDTNRLALLTAQFEDPTGYGRIVRNARGAVVKCVEHKDANAEQLRIKEVNTGFIAARATDLAHWIEQVGNNNAQKEYYLTDVIAIAVEQGAEVADIQASDSLSVLGVNTKAELALLERYYQKKRAAYFLEQGVTIIDPNRFDVRGDIHFGTDCVIDVNVVLEGPLQIGHGVHIEAHNVLRRCRIADNVQIKPQCVIEDAEIGPNAVVGPFARIRPGAKIADHVHIGNFVEIKNSSLATGTKVNHLSYVGDSIVGRNVNIGAGVITCNYDGANKHRTEIEDDVFVGSNSQLVAPVKLGKGVTIGAGSTITDDVPPDNLAVTRAPQKHVKGWRRPRKKTD